MSNKENIKNMYFEGKLDTVEIANELGITKQAVSKTLNKYWKVEYLKEKSIRSKENKIRNVENTKEHIKQKRAKQNDCMIELMHQQSCNSIDMSTTSRLTNRQAVYLNKSAYRMNKKNTGLVYDDKCGAKPRDLPKNFSLKVYF